MTERTAATIWAWISITLALIAWGLTIVTRDQRYLFVVGLLGFVVLAVTRSSRELPVSIRRLSLAVYVVSGVALLALIFTTSGQ